MMKKLMRNSAAAAGFAALLLVGACASNDGLGDNTDVSDDVVQVRPEQVGADSSVYPAPGPAKVDSDGNVYASSAAPGRGNPANVGTNTNVNIIPERSTVQVSESMTSSTLVDDSPAFVDTTASIETTTPVTTVDTTATIETPAPVTVTETTTRTETTTVPMTSSVQESTTTDDDDDDTPAPTRTRMRKD